MNKNTRIEIVSIENANKLFKKYKHNLKVGAVSLVKNSTDKRKVGKSLHELRGPKYQMLIRDIKKIERMVKYKDYEIPSIDNLNRYYDFLDSLKSLDIDLLIFHCRRGVSRSAAFAIATIAYVYDISIEKAIILAKNFKVNSEINKPTANITPNNVILNQFQIILKTRKF